MTNNIYFCFPGGKHKVLTFSYDDGREEDKRLVEIFNNTGMKGTFNINGGLFDVREDRINRDEIKELYEGHEVACHTLTHPTISRCPIDMVAVQLIEDRRELEKIVGYPVRGLAYPNGSETKEIHELLVKVGIKYGRSVKSTNAFAMPEDYTSWDPTCHHRYNLKELGEEFLALHKSQYLYMMYVWGHSYEFPADDNWNVIEDFCEMMSNKDDIWYATNIEIYDYMEAINHVQFTIDFDKVYNPFAFSIWLNVDGNIVEVKGGETKSI